LKVLIVQLRQLGDVLLSAPLAKALKDSLPSVEVHFLTSPLGKEILLGNPYIDEILVLKDGIKGELEIIFNVLKNRYDVVVDVQRTGRSKRITFLSGAKRRIAFRKKGNEPFYNELVNWENRDYTVWERLLLIEQIVGKINYRDYLPEVYFEFESVQLMELLSDKPYVLFVPTARKVEKIWPIENVAALINWLRSKDILSVVCYAPGEEKIIEKLKSEAEFYCPEKPLRFSQLSALMKNSLFFLGNNSFASHLSVALKKKTVVIDKKKSGWFPPVDWVVEIHNNGNFPDFEQVKSEVEKLLKSNPNLV